MMPVRVARDVPAKHVTLSSILNGISSYRLQSRNLQPTSAHRSSQEWTLPCHGGDHRFKSVWVAGKALRSKQLGLSI